MMSLRNLLFGAVLALALPAQTAFAQANPQTLADIRTELGMLYGEIEKLRGELTTSGADTGLDSTGPALMRIDGIEAELRRLTGQVEQLQFRIDSVVKDGTNRVGDLEFRLCELEEGCDVMKLGQTPSLGGQSVETAAPATPQAPQTPTVTAELAVAEKADFDLAFGAYQNGNHNEAAERFAVFASTYPGGPLTGDALFWRGEALAAMGDWKMAARSYLDSFSGSPGGQMAASALHRLGVSLSKLDKVEEACQTFAEVGVRYATSTAASDAATDASALGCS